MVIRFDAAAPMQPARSRAPARPDLEVRVRQEAARGDAPAAVTIDLRLDDLEDLHIPQQISLDETPGGTIARLFFCRVHAAELGGWALTVTYTRQRP